MALTAAPAPASFHLQTANEVMLASASGDANVRFVELYDATSEPFPSGFGPYGLAIYDGAAHKLTSQALSGSGMAGAALANRPYLISTAAADSALSVTGDELLTVALPKPVGQACYTAAGGTPYSCITWGCVKTFVSTSGTGSFHGATPPNGQSAQRQGGGSVQIAAPTPKATNQSGTSPQICPPQFGGVVIPQQTRTVNQGKVPVVVRCPAKAKGRCQGTLVLKTARKIGPKGHRRIVTLGKTTFSIAAGKAPKVRVPLSDAGKNAMSNHKSLGAVATATAHDGTGKTKTTSGQVTVKRATTKR
jgi:hypothetical protein